MENSNKQFQELSQNEQFEIIASISVLAEDFDRYVYESEIECYTVDKLRTLDQVDWSVGVCCHSYLRLKNGDYTSETDAIRFLRSVEDAVKMFSCSANCEKQIGKCNKLIGNNLFVYECKRLCDLYYDEEIAPSIKFVEDVGYAIYCKNWNDDFSDIFDCWMYNHNYFKGEIVWDEELERWAYIQTTTYLPNA